MKSLIIVILLVVLLAVSFFTRPGVSDFRNYLTAQKMEGRDLTSESEIAVVVAEVKLEMEQYDIRNRYLWTEVRQLSDGNMIYLGIFSNWIDWNDPKLPDTPDSTE